jgi:hypothetical protein
MYKGRIINFEWLCDYNRWTPDEFQHIAIKLIKKDIDAAIADKCNIIIGVYLLDGFLYQSHRYTQFVNLLNEIISYATNLGIEKIIIVSGQGEFIDTIPVESHFIDYNTRMIYNSYPISPNVVAGDKFLFLTGMPNRPNRIGLLSKFYDADLLKSAKWSFFAPWTELDKKWCRQHLSHYTDTQYDMFLKECEHSFDSKFETVKPYYGTNNNNTDIQAHDMAQTEWCKSPAYVDSSVFNDTWFSIVSEGPNYWNDENRFVTEKLWRAVLHKQPFIFAGEPAQYHYLKSLGYRIFEEYLLIPNYGTIADEDERLNAVVANTKHWIENKHLYNMQQDTEHNYQLLLKEFDDKNKLLSQFETDYNIPKSEIDFYFNGIGYDRIIRKIPNGF